MTDPVSTTTDTTATESGYTDTAYQDSTTTTNQTTEVPAEDGDVPPADDGEVLADAESTDETSHWSSSSSNTGGTNNTNSTNSTTSTYAYDESRMSQEDRDILMTFEELKQLAQGEGEEALLARTKLQSLLQQQIAQVQQLAQQVEKEEERFDSSRRKDQKGEKASEQTREKLVSKAALMERLLSKVQKLSTGANTTEAKEFFSNLLTLEDYDMTQKTKNAIQVIKRAWQNSQSAQAMRVSQRYARLLQLQQTGGKLSPHQQKTMAQLKEKMAKLGVTEFKAGDAASGKLAPGTPRTQPKTTTPNPHPTPDSECTPKANQNAEGAEKAAEENAMQGTTQEEVKAAEQSVLVYVGETKAQENRRKHEKGKASVSGFIDNLFKKKEALLVSRSQGKEDSELTRTESLAITLGALTYLDRLTQGNPQELGIIILGGAHPTDILGTPEGYETALTGPTSPTSPTIDYDAARAFVATVDKPNKEEFFDDVAGRERAEGDVLARDGRLLELITEGAVV